MDAPDAALQDLIERIRAAGAAGAAGGGLRIRGGGSKDFYGQPPSGDVLDTRAVTGITAYEPSELYATVRAGTPLAELEALLAKHGQCLPFEPPRFKRGLPFPSFRDGEANGPSRQDRDVLPLPPGKGWGEGRSDTPSPGDNSPSTVGGMVAAGLSGPARASAGCVRDYVLGATLVNGRGELLTFGGQVMKNVAGYDVSRVLAGSLGTLGLIAEVSLKVLPVAPAEATLRFEMDQAAALRALNTWGGRPLPLNASAWSDDGGGRLLVRLRGAVAAVDAACAAMGGEREEDAGGGWQALRDQAHSFFTPPSGLALWRLSVPQTAAVLALPYPTLVEWHGAQRWVQAPAGEAGAIRAAAQQAGGHATLFRSGPGGDARPDTFTPLSAPLARIHRALQAQFDPAGIFNPGRLYARL